MKKRKRKLTVKQKALRVVLYLVQGVILVYSFVWTYNQSGEILSSIGMSIMFLLLFYGIVMLISFLTCGLRESSAGSSVPRLTKEEVQDRLLREMLSPLPEKITRENINRYFKEYPEYNLNKWEVFQAWYKFCIDYYLSKPNVFHLSNPDGSVYRKEDDPLYNPEAPDWSEYAQKYGYNDDNDYDDEDDEDDDDGEYDIIKELGL